MCIFDDGDDFTELFLFLNNGFLSDDDEDDLIPDCADCLDTLVLWSEQTHLKDVWVIISDLSTSPGMLVMVDMSLVQVLVVVVSQTLSSSSQSLFTTMGPVHSSPCQDGCGRPILSDSWLICMSSTCSI